MKKTLLATALGIFAAFGAQAETYDFSYVDGVDDYLGVQKAETYDVAIFLPGDDFGGLNIKGVTAAVHGSKGYAGTSIWLASSLNAEEDSFTPDIVSYEAEVSSDATLSATFPESYLIPETGVYVGYTLTVSELNNSTQYPMGFGNCSDPNSFFCRTSNSMPQWSSLASEGWGAAITVTLEVESIEGKSVSVSYIPDPIYMELDNPWTGTFEFTAPFTDTVNSIDIEYAIEGKVSEKHFDITETTGVGLIQKFAVDFEIPAIDHKMQDNVTFKVTKVNGQPNESKDPEATVAFGVFSKVPVHQTLIEEYTGVGCGWCTRGYAALEYIKANEPDFVVAAYHSSMFGKDAMDVVSKFPVGVSGLPYMSLNRKVGGDPYYGSQTYRGKIPVVEEVKAMNGVAASWGIEVSHKWVDDDTLEASSNVWNLYGYVDEAYKIAYILVSDGLTGSGASWIQSNYYANQMPSSDYIDELNQFCKGGAYGKSKVGGLVFNDVVISSTGIHGVDGSVPATLGEEEKASHSNTFDLSKIKPELLPDKNKLRVIAAVVDKDGRVLNCAKNEVNDYVGAGVDGIEDENAPVEYYNLNGQKVSDPSNGIFIRRQGSKTEKVVIR